MDSYEEAVTDARVTRRSVSECKLLLASVAGHVTRSKQILRAPLKEARARRRKIFSFTNFY